MVAGLPFRDNPHVGNRWVHRDNFNRIPGLNADITVAYNLDWETLGTNGVSADHVFDVGGGFILGSHGAATDSGILLPHLDTKQSGLFAVDFKYANQPQFVAHIKTAAALTNTTIWMGFKKTNTPVLITDDDQCIFRYQNGTDTYWQATYSIAGTDVTTSCSNVAAVAAATDYRLWINVDSARVPRFFVNGVLCATGTALTGTVLQIPYIGVLSATDATAKTVIVRSVELSVAI